jgi:hypothetical protein
MDPGTILDLCEGPDLQEARKELQFSFSDTRWSSLALFLNDAVPITFSLHGPRLAKLAPEVQARVLMLLIDEVSREESQGLQNACNQLACKALRCLDSLAPLTARLVQLLHSLCNGDSAVLEERQCEQPMRFASDHAGVSTLDALQSQGTASVLHASPVTTCTRSGPADAMSAHRHSPARHEHSFRLISLHLPRDLAPGVPTAALRTTCV